MARPSPRTGSTGAGIQKFGTQQLKHLDPQLPALGVIEKDVGARTRLAWQEFAGGGGGVTTPFSQQYQQQRPNTIRTLEQLDISDHAIPEGWLGGQFEFPDLFGGGNGNGEDCGWFGEKCWFKPPDWNLGWVKWVLVLIGIGVLLWLLRPLFGIAKNITET